jgi:hypothetical protein
MRRLLVSVSRLVCAVALLSTANYTSAQDKPEWGQRRLFGSPCGQAEAVVRRLFEERGIKISREKSEPNLYSLRTMRIRDADGARLSDEQIGPNFGVTGKRTAREIPLGMRLSGFWSFSHPYILFGLLSMPPESTGCSCRLQFRLGLGQGLIWLIVPFDGDTSTTESDGRLENRYLDEIARRIAAHSDQPNSTAR